MKVTITLDRNPLPAGEVTRLTTEVRNVGRGNLKWLHDGCAISVAVYGQMIDAPWRPGKDLAGAPGLFKERVLGIAYEERPISPPFIGFVPKRWLPSGSAGCADIGIVDTIQPGKAIRAELFRSGSAGTKLGPPPTGPISLTGAFRNYWRAGEDESRSRTLQLTLDAWVADGVPSDWLSPPEVVDAAMASREFVDWLETQNLGTGRAEILWYDQEADVWEVGLLIWYDFPKPMMHVALVDPRTGDVREIVERPWDERRDGFP